MLLGAYSALLIAALVIGGMWAWLLAARTLRHPRHLSAHGLDAQAALRRHPAGRGRWEPGREPGPDPADLPPRRYRYRPCGPDDDPEFISHLERLIRGGGDPDPDS